MGKQGFRFVLKPYVPHDSLDAVVRHASTLRLRTLRKRKHLLWPVAKPAMLTVRVNRDLVAHEAVLLRKDGDARWRPGRTLPKSRKSSRRRPRLFARGRLPPPLLLLEDDDVVDGLALGVRALRRDGHRLAVLRDDTLERHDGLAVLLVGALGRPRVDALERHLVGADEGSAERIVLAVEIGRVCGGRALAVRGHHLRGDLFTLAGRL